MMMIRIRILLTIIFHYILLFIIIINLMMIKKCDCWLMIDWWRSCCCAGPRHRNLDTRARLTTELRWRSVKNNVKSWNGWDTSHCCIFFYWVRGNYKYYSRSKRFWLTCVVYPFLSSYWVWDIVLSRNSTSGKKWTCRSVCTNNFSMAQCVVLTTVPPPSALWRKQTRISFLLRVQFYGFMVRFCLLYHICF